MRKTNNRLGERLGAVKAEHLLAFCKVAEAASVSEAAVALGLSQPAVSRQLASLQRAVGKSLYERTASGVRLTQAGRDLLPFACAVARALERTRRYLRGDLAGRPVSLRLGLSHHLVTRYTGPLLKAAKDGARDLDLKLHLVEGYSDALGEEVLNGQLDAGLVLGEARDLPEGLARRRHSEDHICLLVLPDDPIATLTYAPLSVVEGETLILPSSVSRLFKTVESGLGHARVRPGRVLEVSGPAAVRSAVMAGEGIGVTLRSFVAPEVGATWLRCVGLENEGFTVGVNLITPDPATLDPGTSRALQVVVGSALP